MAHRCRRFHDAPQQTRQPCNRNGSSKSPSPQQLSGSLPSNLRDFVVEERVNDIQSGTQEDCRAVNTILLPISTNSTPCHPVNPKLSSPASEPQSQSILPGSPNFQDSDFFLQIPGSLPINPSIFPPSCPDTYYPACKPLLLYPQCLSPCQDKPRSPLLVCSLPPPSFHLHCTWHRASSLAKPWLAPHSLFGPHSPAESVALNPITSHHSPVKQLHPSPPPAFLFISQLPSLP